MLLHKPCKFVTSPFSYTHFRCSCPCPRILCHAKSNCPNVGSVQHQLQTPGLALTNIELTEESRSPQTRTTTSETCKSKAKYKNLFWSIVTCHMNRRVHRNNLTRIKVIQLKLPQLSRHNAVYSNKI